MNHECQSGATRVAPNEHTCERNAKSVEFLEILDFDNFRSDNSKNTTFSVTRDWTVTISDPSEEIGDNYRRVYGSGIEVPTKKLLYS